MSFLLQFTAVYSFLLLLFIDVKSSGPVLVKQMIQVFFPSDCRAAGMKDLVRQFIRKAKLVCLDVSVCFFVYVCTCKKEYTMHTRACEIKTQCWIL